MNPFFTSIDLNLFHLINQAWISSFFDFLMPIASSFDLFKIPLLLGALALVIWGRFRERLFLVLLGILILVGDAGVCHFLKKEIQRPRPHEVLSGVRVVTRNEVRVSEPTVESRGRSFPSAHVWNNIAAAILLLQLYGKKAWLGIPWVLLVSYSRIYTGSHYPSDILFSFVLGGGFAWSLLWLLHWGWRTNGHWIAPKLWNSHPLWWGWE